MLLLHVREPWRRQDSVATTELVQWIYGAGDAAIGDEAGADVRQTEGSSEVGSRSVGREDGNGGTVDITHGPSGLALTPPGDTLRLRNASATVAPCCSWPWVAASSAYFKYGVWHGLIHRRSRVEAAMSEYETDPITSGAWQPARRRKSAFQLQVVSGFQDNGGEMMERPATVARLGICMRRHDKSAVAVCRQLGWTHTLHAIGRGDARTNCGYRGHWIKLSDLSGERAIAREASGAHDTRLTGRLPRRAAPIRSDPIAPSVCLSEELQRLHEKTSSFAFNLALFTRLRWRALRASPMQPPRRNELKSDSDNARVPSTQGRHPRMLTTPAIEARSTTKSLYTHDAGIPT